jgi:hypothetical protein
MSGKGAGPSSISFHIEEFCKFLNAFPAKGEVLFLFTSFFSSR